MQIYNPQLLTWCLKVIDDEGAELWFVKLASTERGKTKAARPSSTRNIIALQISSKVQTLEQSESISVTQDTSSDSLQKATLDPPMLQAHAPQLSNYLKA